MLKLTSLTNENVYNGNIRRIVREGIERVLCHRELGVYLSATVH